MDTKKKKNKKQKKKKQNKTKKPENAAWFSFIYSTNIYWPGHQNEDTLLGGSDVGFDFMSLIKSGERNE